MIVKQKKRGFICTTSHPTGCVKNVQNQIEYVKSNKELNGPKNVLVLGCSTGYGLASRIVSAFSFKAKTIGVSFEKEPSEKRTATAGWYNNRAFDIMAEKEGIYSKTLNLDAFSMQSKKEVAELVKSEFGKVDMVVYSLASPKRSLDDGTTYKSVIKPIGNVYSNKSINLDNNEVVSAEFEPASEEEILETVKVMGGEDWLSWIEVLKEENLLADNFVTMAYSYIGPEITHPIYMNGTIGMAKRHLKETSDKLNEVLKDVNGKSFVSVNKALVTQASSAIPVVPLYISILYKVMKEKGLHEHCIEQMYRLFDTYYDNSVIMDKDGFIRMDDYEMREDVQSEVVNAWNNISSENVSDYTDLEGFHKDFDNLFGFELDGVNYDEDVSLII